MTTPLNKYNSTIYNNGNLVNGTNNTISSTTMLKSKYHILGEIQNIRERY
jgi:hypothetical protein